MGHNVFNISTWLMCTPETRAVISGTYTTKYFKEEVYNRKLYLYIPMYNMYVTGCAERI